MDHRDPEEKSREDLRDSRRCAGRRKALLATQPCVDGGCETDGSGTGQAFESCQRRPHEKTNSRASIPPEDRATNDRILQDFVSTRRVLQQLPGMLVQRLQSCPMGLDNLVAIAAARQRFLQLVIGERAKLVSLARTVYGRAPPAPAKTSRGSRRGKNTPVLKIVRQKAKGFHDGILKHIKLGKRIPGTPKILDQPFHAPTVTTKAMKATKK